MITQANFNLAGRRKKERAFRSEDPWEWREANDGTASRQNGGLRFLLFENEKQVQ